MPKLPAKYLDKELQSTAIANLSAAVLQFTSAKSTKNVEFAEGLITQYKQKGDLSPNQWPWVLELPKIADEKLKAAPSGTVDLATALGQAPNAIDHQLPPIHEIVKPKKKVINIGEYVQAFGFLTLGQSKLQNPKITLTRGDYKFTFSLVKYGKFSGTIRVMDGIPTGWVANILPNGNLMYLYPGISTEKREAFFDLAIDFGLDPERTVTNNGQIHGICCFCNIELTDPKSIAAGYGPVCAKHYNLYEKWKSAVGNNLVQKQVGAIIDAQTNGAYDAKKNFEITGQDLTANKELVAPHKNESMVADLKPNYMTFDYGAQEAKIMANVAESSQVPVGLLNCVGLETEEDIPYLNKDNDPKPAEPVFGGSFKAFKPNTVGVIMSTEAGFSESWLKKQFLSSQEFEPDYLDKVFTAVMGKGPKDE
jgi:hypothetical protein